MAEQIFYQNFCKTYVGKGVTNLIFDIGANEGWLTEIFAEFGKVIAAEPDRFCQRVLQARFKNQAAVVVVPKAVSEVAGEQPFYLQQQGAATNTLSEKWKKTLEEGRCGVPSAYQTYTVQTLTLDQLIATFGVPDYIKIDTEGHELAVIKGLTKPIPLITFEANLPEFLEETESIIDYLLSLNARYTFNYFVDFRIQLPANVGAADLKRLLYANTANSVDIICQLS